MYVLKTSGETTSSIYRSPESDIKINQKSSNL